MKVVVDINALPCNNGKDCTECAFYPTVDICEMTTVLRNFPKYKEPKHGEWIDESKDALKCSACGKWVYKPFIGGFPTERTQHYNPNYCAFCGADMRKESEAE